MAPRKPKKGQTGGKAGPAFTSDRMAEQDAAFTPAPRGGKGKGGKGKRA